MSPLVRALVHFTVFYTCIEGLVVNVLYPARLPFVYKDIVLVVVYVAVLLPNLHRVLGSSPLANRLNGALVLFIGLLAVYLAVPSPTTMISELVALKQRLFYVPLVIVGYYFVRSPDDVKHLFVMMTVYAIGCSAFGIYLFFTGPEGLRALGADYAAIFYTPTGPSDVSTWRVPGTFTSSGQYGAYLMFNAIVASALLLLPRLERRTRAIAAIALVSIVLAMLASGSRASIVLTTAAVAIALVLSGRLARLGVWGVAVYALLAYGFVVFGPGVEDRIGSIASAEHLERFQRTYFGQLFLPSLLEHPLGSGLGVATIGARHFSEFYQVVLMESYLGILAVETGWPGLLAFLFVAYAVGDLVVRHRRLMVGSPFGVLWLALAAYAVISLLILPISTSIDHAPSNFYFWLTIGIVIRLIEIEHWRLWELRESAVATAAGPVAAPLGHPRPSLP